MGIAYGATFLQDARYAIRAIRSSPAFALTAIAALALGIGANTAVFPVVNAVLLKPLGFPAPERIALFFVNAQSGPVYGASATKFNVLRRQSGAFEKVSAYEYNGAGLNLTGGVYPEQIHGIRVSADYFSLFGAPLALGRTFTAEEDKPGGERVAVLSYGLWRRRFGSDPHLPGKAISLSGTPYTVVGVLGSDFNTELDSPPDVFLPFQIDPNSADHAQFFNVVGRLRPGVTVAMANSALGAASAEFRRNFPQIAGPRDRFAAAPFPESMVSDVKPSLLVLAGAVGLVLLIACANVANLLLARASGRKREIAIRAAMGAGRGRIVRQLLTESLVLSALAGALGLALGMGGMRALLALNPGDLPRIGREGAAVSIDWRVAVFTILVSLGAGVLFGLAPALGGARAGLSAILKESGGRSATDRRNGARSILVVSETALAVVLLLGAAELIRTFVALRSVDPGVSAHNVLTMRMSLAGSRFNSTTALASLIDDATRRIEALPGVVRAAASYNLPLQGVFGVPFNIAGRPAVDGRYDGRGWQGVSAGYFEAFQIPIRRGRAFSARDSDGANQVAVINQALARKFWLHEEPVGERVILGRGYGPEFEDPAREIVGVAGDVHDFGLNHTPTPMVYVPLAQVPSGLTGLVARVASLAWIVRTRAAPYSLSSAIETELRKASGGLPVATIRSMDQIMAESTSRADFNMWLLTIFGGAALLLAAIGIYGLMAYSVEQRSQEIGIRIALGAEPGAVRKMVVAQGMRLAAIGIGIGVLAGLALTRLLSSFLFGVGPRDAVAFIAAPLVLGAVALLAVWVPARRAARIDPVIALRNG